MEKYARITERAINKLYDLVDNNGLNRTDILVFITMNVLSINAGEFFIYKNGKETIANKMRISIETIKKSILRLKNKGLIISRYRYKIVPENKVKYTTSLEIYMRKKTQKGIKVKESHYIINDIGIRGAFTAK
jgi:hypothetical protein